jgi:hypothetical protein
MDTDGNFGSVGGAGDFKGRLYEQFSTGSIVEGEASG